MQYGTVISGQFITRPNRFVAIVDTGEREEVCHVKNTGRCRELLVPHATVYLERAVSTARKTALDLIAVRKGNQLINMDAQAPNKVFKEWVLGGGFDANVINIKPEYSYGASRIDFCLETTHGLHLVEVKGVTLEENGHACFPDAPTERGIKHIRELQNAVRQGLSATLFFVVQMEGILDVSPNDRTHPAFGIALREAVSEGVAVRAVDCQVNPDRIEIRREIPVTL